MAYDSFYSSGAFTKMSINVPNQITLGRLALAIVFCVLLTWYDVRQPEVWLMDVCLVIFVVAALTDVLDGYIARRYEQVTTLGRMLDPFVDKVLVCGAFVFFAGEGFVDSSGRNISGVQSWMVVVVVGRELLVTSLRSFSEAQGQAFGATVYGKVKMVIQSVTAMFILLYVGHYQQWEALADLAWLKIALVWLTVVVTALSMISYLHKSRRVFLGQAGA